ncbi:MAG TPA: hypothetical protein ENJ28_07775 [Gammaproteobacteria bacterium]|nr:hypothetical protein [Gammaproteobacteria bacterium]
MRLLANMCVLLFLLPAYLSATEKKMPSMHHLVKIKPSENISIPDGFSLNDDAQIDCITCHEIKDIDNIPLDEINKKDKKFFRQGPYKKLSDFCFRCHKKNEYKRLNIHKLLDERGEIKKKQCLFCHLKTPDVEKNSYADLEFRIPPEKLCYGCHLSAPHLNAINHAAQKPDKSMLKRIRSAEKKQGVILPLDGEGRVMCTTCHSPHQAGVIDRKKPAGRQIEDCDLDEGIRYQKHVWSLVYRRDKQARLKRLSRTLSSASNSNANNDIRLDYKQIKAEILLRLPAKDGSLCLSCHTFEK